MSLKVKWPFPPNGKFTGLKNYASKTEIIFASLVAKFWIEKMNTYKLHNEKHLVESITNRPNGRPLLTVSNHMSVVDDPAIFAGMLGWKTIWNGDTKAHRWGTAAADICFTRELYSKFCALGRTIPVVRGGGVFQRGVDFAIDRLNEGDWVHMFPEGRVRYVPENLRLKWGVGRMIADIKTPDIIPDIIPLYFLGIEDVVPSTSQRSSKILRVGKKTTVCVGEKLVFTELIQKYNAEKKCEVELRKAITDVIQDELAALRIKCEKLHYETTKS